MTNPPRLAKGETQMKSNAMRKESESETAGRTTQLRVLRSEVRSGVEAAEIFAPVAPFVIAAIVFGVLVAVYAVLGILNPGLGLPAPIFPAVP